MSATPAGTNTVATGTDTTRKLVSAAFGLGWQVAELHPLIGAGGTGGVSAAGTAGGAAGGALPRAHELSAPQRAAHLRTQIATNLATLDGQLGLPDEVAAPLAEAWAAYATDESGERLATLHAALLGTLHASDTRLGTAYDLGVGLSGMCVRPADPTAAWYAPERAEELRRELADLHTVLPDHAAMAVLGSLLMWERHARDLTWEEAGTLPEQGRAWRALLSGDKSATQDLSLPDHVAAARRAVETARRFGEDILRSIFSRRHDADRSPENEEDVPRTRWIWVVGLAFVVLLVATIVLAVRYEGVSAWLAGIVALLSGAGGLGYLKRLWDGMESMWDQVREPLLGATLDVFIAAAITQLPEVRRIEDLRTEIERELHPTGLRRRQPVEQPQPAQPAGR